MVRDPNIKHVTLPSLDLTGVLGADCVVAASGWIPGVDSRDDLGLFAPLLTARPRNDESIDYRPSIDPTNERRSIDRSLSKCLTTTGAQVLLSSV